MKRHKERMASDPEYRRKYEENTERQNERRRLLRNQAKLAGEAGNQIQGEAPEE